MHTSSPRWGVPIPCQQTFGIGPMSDDLVGAMAASSDDSGWLSLGQANRSTGRPTTPRTDAACARVDQMFESPSTDDGIRFPSGT